MPGECPSKIASDRKANVNIDVVDVVDKSYMERTWKDPEWSRVIDNVVLEFMLNEEQERGFRIISNHVASSRGGQLKMYLGGMAGTGKSQALKALASYFAARNESHHFVIVAPTGSAAALLGGSTYHYMFRAGHRNPSIRFYGTLHTVPVTVPSVFWQAFYTVRVMVRAGPVNPVNNTAVNGTTTVDGSRVPRDNVYPALIDSSIPSK